VWLATCIIVLKISGATFLPNIINIGQNFTKLLQKLQGGRFYPDTVQMAWLIVRCILQSTEMYGTYNTAAF